MLFFWHERPVLHQPIIRDGGVGQLQKGFVSSHFFFRFRHVVQPVLDRAFACFDAVVGERGGWMRGRPRRLSRTGSVGDIGVSSPTGSGLTSASWSSVSSILGTISSDPSRDTTRSSERESAVENPVVSNVGVFAGDSLLEDMEG